MECLNDGEASDRLNLAQDPVGGGLEDSTLLVVWKRKSSTSTIGDECLKY